MMNRLIRMLKRKILFLLAKFPFKIKSYSKARHILNKGLLFIKSSSLWDHKFENIEYDLQIIIPFFNSEKSVNECIKSVIRQKHNDFSFCITAIDDGSTDRTFDLLRAYRVYPFFYLIKTDNKGPANARNEALKIGKGRYIVYIDSDDALLDDALEKMYNSIANTNLEYVQFSYYRNYEDSIEKITPSIPQSYPWGKIFDYRIFEKFHFPDNHWFEDTFFYFIVFDYYKKYEVNSDPVYIYKINNSSITFNLRNDYRSIDSIWILEICLQDRFLCSLPFDETLSDKVIAHIIITYGRLSQLPCRIKESFFSYCCYLFKKFNICPPSENYLKIYKSIINKSYFSFLYSIIYFKDEN